MHSIGAGTIAGARPDAAGISIGADRPSSIVYPRTYDQQFRQKEMSPSASTAAPLGRPVRVGLTPSSPNRRLPRARA
jgi:hypothetical protein